MGGKSVLHGGNDCSLTVDQGAVTIENGETQHIGNLHIKKRSYPYAFVRECARGILKSANETIREAPLAHNKAALPVAQTRIFPRRNGATVYRGIRQKKTPPSEGGPRYLTVADAVVPGAPDSDIRPRHFSSPRRALQGGLRENSTKDRAAPSPPVFPIPQCGTRGIRQRSRNFSCRLCDRRTLRFPDKVKFFRHYCQQRRGSIGRSGPEYARKTACRPPVRLRRSRARHAFP